MRLLPRLPLKTKIALLVTLSLGFIPAGFSSTCALVMHADMRAAKTQRWVADFSAGISHVEAFTIGDKNIVIATASGDAIELLAPMFGVNSPLTHGFISERTTIQNKYRVDTYAASLGEWGTVLGPPIIQKALAGRCTKALCMAALAPLGPLGPLAMSVLAVVDAAKLGMKVGQLAEGHKVTVRDYGQEMRDIRQNVNRLCDSPHCSARRSTIVVLSPWKVELIANELGKLKPYDSSFERLEGMSERLEGMNERQDEMLEYLKRAMERLILEKQVL